MIERLYSINSIAEIMDCSPEFIRARIKDDIRKGLVKSVEFPKPNGTYRCIRVSETELSRWIKHYSQETQKTLGFGYNLKNTMGFLTGSARRFFNIYFEDKDTRWQTCKNFPAF